jgi:hypothetical protein
MKSKKILSKVHVEYMNLSKKGMLSAYEWYVVRIVVETDGGKTVIVREDSFDEKAPAWDAYNRYRKAIA